MSEEIKSGACCSEGNCCCKPSRSNKYSYKVKASDGGVGFFMFLSFIGAAVYFIGQASDFWGGVVGFLKALVWPAFLIFEVLAGYGV